MRLFLIASAALSVFGLTQALDQHAAQPACREKYTGDTCQSIASKHHVTKDHLAEWTKKLEPSFDCDKIKPGQFICVDYASIERRDAHEYRHPAHNKFHPKKPTTTHAPPPPKPTHAPKEPEHEKRDFNDEHDKKPAEHDKKRKHPKKPTSTHVPPPPKPTHAPKEPEHEKREVKEPATSKKAHHKKPHHKKPAKKHTTKAKPARN
ncbi:hypothetical protein RMCBS344292_02422 [Rhizopus microsporus]|nr:hypothetical protein RMCBS344292_02422 [Rhizopus microsporus]